MHADHFTLATTDVISIFLVVNYKLYKQKALLTVLPYKYTSYTTYRHLYRIIYIYNICLISFRYFWLQVVGIWTAAAVAQAKGLELSPTWQLSVASKAEKLTENKNICHIF